MTFFQAFTSKFRVRVKCGMQNAENQQRVKCGKSSAEYSAFYPLCHIRVSAPISVPCHRSPPKPVWLYFNYRSRRLIGSDLRGPPYYVRTMVRTVCSNLSLCLFLSTTNARLYTYKYIHTRTPAHAMLSL